MSREIDTRAFFTADSFMEMNGPDYKKGDIRTYRMPPLARIPQQDIEIHLSVPDQEGGGFTSISTNRGSFAGNFTVETRIKAEKSVLNFPAASEIVCRKGMVKIDSAKIDSLYPSWMVTRYGSENLRSSLILHHEVPFFLDKGTKKFVMFFDEAFLDEIDPNVVTEGADSGSIRVYKGKQDRLYLAIVTSDFSHLTGIGKSTYGTEPTPAQQAFRTIQENYKRLMVDASKLEKVIVIDYKCTSEKSRTEFRSDLPVDVFRNTLDLHFHMAGRYNDQYYLIDESGHMDTRSSAIVSRPHARDQYSEEGRSCVVIPYAEQDWNKLIEVKNGLDNIQNAILVLVKGCEGEKGSKIDQSLSETLGMLSMNRLKSLPKG